MSAMKKIYDRIKALENEEKTLFVRGELYGLHSAMKWIMENKKEIQKSKTEEQTRYR